MPYSNNIFSNNLGWSEVSTSSIGRTDVCFWAYDVRSIVGKITGINWFLIQSLCSLNSYPIAGYLSPSSHQKCSCISMPTDIYSSSWSHLFPHSVINLRPKEVWTKLPEQWEQTKLAWGLPSRDGIRQSQLPHGLEDDNNSFHCAADKQQKVHPNGAKALWTLPKPLKIQNSESRAMLAWALPSAVDFDEVKSAVSAISN